MAETDRSAARFDLLSHRRQLASALFTIYYRTSVRERDPRGWRASSIAEALAVLDRTTPTTDPFHDKKEKARKLFLALAQGRMAGDKAPLAGAGGFFPHWVVKSKAEQRGGSTTARVVVVINMAKLTSMEDRFRHIASAVDPRSWVETGFFADMYRIERNELGIPVLDENGRPRKDVAKESEVLGITWKDPKKLHPDFVDLVFEDFDLANIEGEPLSAYRNVFGIESFTVERSKFEFKFRLYQSVSSSLLGNPRSGGMDRNEGVVTADNLTPDRFVRLFGDDIEDFDQFLSLSKALKDAEVVQAVRKASTALNLGDPTTLTEEEFKKLLKPCVKIEATKTVRFTDLTPQGEPFIDIGEILNYAAPEVLKPAFELLLVLGATANPNDKEGLGQIVELREGAPS